MLASWRMLLHAARSSSLKFGSQASQYSARAIARSTTTSSPLRSVRAMGVDPQVKDFLAEQNKASVSYDTLTPEEARSSAIKLLK